MDLETRNEIKDVLYMGAALEARIREREEYIRDLGCAAVGQDFTRPCVQATRTTTAIEATVDRLRDDRELRRMRGQSALYLRIMATLTPRQREFVHWRFRCGYKTNDVAVKMGIHPTKARELASRVYRRAEKLMSM